MNQTLFLLIALALAAISFYIGVKQKDIKNNKEYLLGNKNISIIPLSFSLFATQLGGGVILGSAEAAYNNGWIAFFYPLGLCLGLFIMGIGYGEKVRAMEINTLAEIFEKYYNSKILRKFASIISIVSLSVILMAMGIATRKFFTTIGVENEFIYPLFWLVLVAYTTMGGLKSVIQTDLIQALFIIIAFALIVFVNTSELKNITTIIHDETLFNSSISWSAWIILPMLYLLVEQSMGQRCFAADSQSGIRNASLLAAAMLLISAFIPTAFGIISAKIVPVIPENNSALMLTIEQLTNPAIVSIFYCAIFMAIISTADSMLCSITSNISYDFIDGQSSDEQYKLKFAKLTTFSLGVASLFCSYFFNSVMHALILSYEFSVCCLSIPIVMATIMPKYYKMPAILSVIIGSTAFILFKFITIPAPKEIVTLSLALISYLIGYFFADKCANECTSFAS